MQPFDYRIAVQDPLQMALAGYQQGQQFQQQRVQAERETQLYNMEMQQYQANQAKLQQEQARAQQLQANIADFVGRSERKELVEGDYERFLAENYELPEPALKALEGLNERQLQERTRSLTQVSMLMASDVPQPDENSLVVKYYREQQAAAEASGDPQRAALADAAARTYMSNPEAAKVAANATLLATDPTAFAAVQPFILPKPKEAASSAGKVIADYNAGFFGEVGSPEAIRVRDEQITKAGGGQNISVYAGGEPAGADITLNAFREKYGTNVATQVGTLSDNALAAGRNIDVLGRLESELARAPSGVEAGLKIFAGELGISSEGIVPAQAANAIIAGLVPKQRTEGSGSSSDKDVAEFKRSLPNLLQSPEGRTQIIRNLRAMNEYAIKEGAIANRLARGEPGFGIAEYQDALAALGSPLKGAGAAPAAGGALPVINNQASYDALPAGSDYTTGDGITRTKP